MDPSEVYLAVRACYKGGRFIYRQADKRVAAFADAEGISKQEAWGRVRAEAKRLGDQNVERLADGVLGAGPLGAVLIPGGQVILPLARAWKQRKDAR